MPSTFVVTNSEAPSLDRLLDVRLGRGVDDHVDALDELAHERRVADVAVHEREARVAHHVGEVLEVAGVGERVERHDLVRGRLEQVADEVRRDEPRTARDQHALAHSSSSIVYSGLPSTSRWIAPERLADQREHESLDAEHENNACSGEERPGEVRVHDPVDDAVDAERRRRRASRRARA